jgi:two-component system cell cycle sensor histidine kinase/response regulator CckA
MADVASLRPTTVLIVDDEEPIRRVVERILMSAGYITRLASSGADAIAAADGVDSIDVLVTDMMMPEMNGDEVARRLRQKHPALKVLYYTGYGDRLFDQKNTMWEDEAFLEKPCSAKGLLEAVSLLCSRNQRISGGSSECRPVPATKYR